MLVSYMYYDCTIVNLLQFSYNAYGGSLEVHQPGRKKVPWPLSVKNILWNLIKINEIIYIHSELSWRHFQESKYITNFLRDWMLDLYLAYSVFYKNVSQVWI